MNHPFVNDPWTADLRRPRGNFTQPDELAWILSHLRASSTPPSCIYELGVGDGRMLVAFAEAFPEAEVVGIELRPARCAHARGLLGERATVYHGDAVDFDLAPADVLYFYLGAVVNQLTFRPGQLLLTGDTVGGLEGHEEASFQGSEHVIRAYRVPG